MRKASKFFRRALSPTVDSPVTKVFPDKVHDPRKMSFTSSTEGGMGMLPDFDPLVVSAFELSELLNAQAISCVEIVELYLHQIEQHNRRGRQLRALISVAPKHELLKIAKKLDDERLRGKIRGPLHGIPIVLKDNIMTDEQLGMDTTVGKPSIRRAILSKLTLPRLICFCRMHAEEECDNC
jgi:amidase